MTVEAHSITMCHLATLNILPGKRLGFYLLDFMFYEQAHYGPLNSHTVESLFFQVCVPEVTLHSSLSFNEKTLVCFN